MSEAQDKGDALEKAVKYIESAILESMPGYSEKSFKVGWKKRFIVDSVTHEVDVFVEIDLGNEYKSIIIFECKNRTEKADKNDVIILSEKIDVLQAQKGFLVARHFTKDAEAQALKNPRIALVTAKDLLPEELKNLPGGMIVMNYESERYTPILNAKNAHILQGIKFDDSSVIAEMDYRKFIFAEYFKNWREDLFESFDKKVKTRIKYDGIYTFTVEDMRIFKGRLKINGIPIRDIILRAAFTIKAIFPSVISHFDISTRGRVLVFAPVGVVGGVEIGESFITFMPPKAPEKP